MDLKDFQYLIALADEGSVSKAADRLYMSQSSLSQSLQQCESELGVKLFLRTSKGIHPTANGEVFIGHLRQMKSSPFAVGWMPFEVRRKSLTPSSLSYCCRA